MEDQIGPIGQIARESHQYFEKCLTRFGHSDTTILADAALFIQEYLARFNAWTSYLGVLAVGNSSLDYRLRNHPALKDIIMRLLDMLRRNLFLVSVREVSETAERPAIHPDGHGGLLTMDVLPAILTVEFSGIRDSITRLNKVGVAIRSSSRSTAIARARRFASQRPDIARLNDFEHRAYLALSSLYPRAPETLLQHLSDSMTDRYAKLTYESYRVGYAGELPTSGVARDTNPDELETDRARHQLSTLIDEKDKVIHKSTEDHMGHGRAEIPGSSVDTNRLPEILGAAATATSRSRTMTVHVTRPKEPPLPKFDNDKNHTTCQFCFQVIDRSFVRSKGINDVAWSARGQRHYRDDLQPYVCIAEACSQSRPTYSSSRAWFDHMMSNHSPYWSQNIHQLATESPSAASTCPICLFSCEPEPTPGGEPVDEHHDEPHDATLTRQSLQGEKMQVDSNVPSRKRVKLSSDRSGTENITTTWSMGLHVAQHLHYLMIVSLQLMSAMDAVSYGEGGDGSISSLTSGRLSTFESDERQRNLVHLQSDSQASTLSFSGSEKTESILKTADGDTSQEESSWAFLHKDETAGLEVDKKVIQAFQVNRHENPGWPPPNDLPGDLQVNYETPPLPPIKYGEVSVRAVTSSRPNVETSVDDEEGHYIVVPDAYFAENYQIVKLIGGGTFSKVVQARTRQTNELVAIKIIRALTRYRDASRIELRVLATLKANDPQNRNRCIHLRDCFDYLGHICIVTELLDQSVFEYLKSNDFVPFPNSQIRNFSRQLFGSVAFLKDLNLIHTDIKPENMVLKNSAYQTFTYNRSIPSASATINRTAAIRRVLLNTEIQLTDFGAATFQDEYHSAVISTRHYRAPEIILGIGWSYPCDVWSIGCILIELFTGDALFQTHDNLEHLAMMEAVIDKKIDSRLVDIVKRNSSRAGDSAAKYFKKLELDYPTPDTSRGSRRFVKAMKSLEDIIQPKMPFLELFLDLLRKIFVFDPAVRITAKEALKHPWFAIPLEGDDGTEAAKIKLARESMSNQPDNQLGRLGEKTEDMAGKTSV